MPKNSAKQAYSALRILAAWILIAGCSSARMAKSDTRTLTNIRAHISYLADDKLEGRRTGTPGEKLAMEYIRDRFREEGLEPKGDSGYFQPFEVYDGKKINDSTMFSINGHLLKAGKDFFPFPFSAQGSMQALPSIAIQEAEMPWFFDLKEVLQENSSNPHFDLPEYIHTNARKAADRGASAIILYNTSSTDDKLAFDPKDRRATLPLPVLYVKKDVADQYFKDISATLDIRFRVSLGEQRRTGHNVAGYINNNAATTIVLGAHFDHLGYGEDGNSRNTSHDPAIHNGADDNASGTAALIELARKLKENGPKTSNYLFLAFSGEELGLFGSKYFTEHPTVNLKEVSFMINMDMVGRLNDSTHVVTVGGYGTSPLWGQYYSRIPETNKDNRTAELVFRYDSSGTGPSDHTSFYRKDIPVLFYFTGLHPDYHKPTDDADKINYTGETAIVDHIMDLVSYVQSQPRPQFTKTREAQTTTSARFSVSLGIMPDYTYPGSGVRADGVSEGKAAQKAGLLAGDIIIQLGDHPITSLETYMQALSNFKKGDSTKVKFKRGEETKEATVQF